MATKWGDRLNLFRSARWTLTLFYLSIIVLFNLLVTFSVRVYAEHEFLRSNSEQFGEVQQLAARLFDMPLSKYDVNVTNIEDNEATIVRQRLNDGLLVINLCALAVGGILSYWFAGRALLPLQEAHEAQARFTADASHEMKTPLANMRLENEIFLRQKTFTEKDAREQLESNLEEVHRLEKLSLNLLALHQYGQVDLGRSAIIVKRLIADALDQFSAIAAARKVAVRTDLEAATVLGHQDSLVQLLGILLDNALKYGGRGGEIVISGSKKGRWYVVGVADKGPGIAPKDLPHIFDRLYRGDKARSTRVFGYGLGLSLAKEIALANRANIVARNNPDGGAVFQVWLELTTSLV